MRYWAKRSLGINEKEFLDPDRRIIQVEGDMDEEKLRQITLSPMDGMLSEVRQMKIEELKETTGTRDVNQGMSGGVTAASAITALQEAGDKSSRDCVSGSYRAYVAVMEQVVELIRQFYTGTRCFRIAGDGGWKYIRYSNRGLRDSIQTEMAVLSPDGAMVGYVVACTDRYSVALSVLNTSFRASGKLADSDYSGSICWDGLDPHVVVLDELSKYADPKPGDEVVTTGFSQYFPPDVLIGWVESASLNETRTAYTVRVRLAAELSRLSDVVLVGNRDLYEIRALQQSEQVEQHTRTN